MSAVPLLEVPGNLAVPSERPRRSAPAAQVSVWPVTQGGATVVSIDEARRRLRQETAGNVSVDTDAVTVAGAHAAVRSAALRRPLLPEDELSRSLRQHPPAPPAAPAPAIPLLPELPRLTPMGSVCLLLPHLLSVAVHF